MHPTIRLGLVAASCVVVWLHGVGAEPSASTAQSLPLPTADPLRLPLLHGNDLRYLGKFNAPDRDGTGRPEERDALTWGGTAIGVGADGKSLYFGCHDWHRQLARVSVPEFGEVGSVLLPCTPINNLQAVSPTDRGPKVLGGSLAWNGKLILSAYVYYDAEKLAVASHFVAAPDLSSVQGPYRVGRENPGLIGGYMGIVPPEWRTLLGGPALTGLCCISIIGRSSYGPSASVFNPDDLGVVSPARSTMLVGYPEDHQTLGAWNGYNAYYSGATSIAGIAFPAGTRSVLFVGRHPGTFCYGTGTPIASLDGQPDGQGGRYCYNPTSNAKGTHGYPYRHQVWAYDAKDLADVKAGRRDPWDVRPYAVWALTEMSGGRGDAHVVSAAFDQATQRLYIATGGTSVHVYEVSRGAGPSTPDPGPNAAR